MLTCWLGYAIRWGVGLVIYWNICLRISNVHSNSCGIMLHRRWDNVDLFEFLEQSELNLIQQLCSCYPDLSLDQIEMLVEDFGNELDNECIRSFELA